MKKSHYAHGAVASGLYRPKPASKTILFFGFAAAIKLPPSAVRSFHANFFTMHRPEKR